ncbi:MAG: ATP synthase F1 subunit epsilon [Candidatus Krumholzibacteriota bacterium]|nr:ATP synthase F1 subunit epsilon [Candidatus Krumholzibacteriota bacterium]
MAATYNFRILTPGEKALDTDVISIVAPGEAGYLGVLANHAPLITTLTRGNLRVRFADNRETHYRIGSGLLKVAHNEVVILTESIEEA